MMGDHTVEVLASIAGIVALIPPEKWSEGKFYAWILLSNT